MLAVLLLAVIAFFFFYPDNAQGNVLQQHDIQQGLANGHEQQQFHERTGETTRWTDALFGGMPTFQISPSYPANKALDWISTIYTLGLPSPSNLLFGLMLGFFIMCLCLKQRWYVALLGAIGWGFSTYFIIIIGAGHIWKFLTLMYIPPTIGGVALLYRGKYIGGAALTALFGALQLMSNHIQMTYYFLFVVLAMMIAWLIEAARNKNMRRWLIATAWALGSGIVAVGANAPSLYSTYEYSKETVRGRSTELASASGTHGEKGGPDLDYMTQWSYGADETLTLLIPNVKGGASLKPVEGESRILSVADTDTATEMVERGSLSPEEWQALTQFTQYFGDQPMTNGPVYVGAMILLLAILALFVVEGPMKWCLFGVTILGILLSWGHNLMWFTELFANFVPMYSKFRTVSSILVIVEFTLPLLAVMCVRKMISTPDFLDRYKWQFIGVMGGGALICLAGWLSPGIFGSAFSASELEFLQQQGVFSNPQYNGILQAISKSRMDLVSHDCIRSFFFILCGTGVLMLWFKGAVKQPAVVVSCLAAVVLIDLFTVNTRYVNSENFVSPTEDSEAFRETDADRAILQDKSHYRVYDAAEFGGARSSYFHKTIGGYHAAKLTRYNDLLEHQILKKEGPNPEVLNMLNAKYVLSGNQYQQNPDALGNAWFVEKISYVDSPDAEMKALDSIHAGTEAVADKAFASTLGNAVAKSVGDTIVLKSYEPNKLVFNTRSAKDNVAVISEVYFPWGWKATIDGKEAPIGRVNYVLRAMRVPAGQHTVEMLFDPESIKVTDRISIASVSLIYVLCAVALIGLVLTVRGRRKDSAGSKAEKADKDEK